MSDYEDFLVTGDVVAGRYNKLGAPSALAKVSGSTEEINELNKKLSSIFLGGGGEKIQFTTNGSNKKRSAVKKKITPTIPNPNVPTIDTTRAIDPEYQKYYDSPTEEVAEVMQQDYLAPVLQKKITLQNEFGSIRMEVEDILISNWGFLLVFTDENKINFIPKPGQVIDFGDADGNFTSVVYPDTLFTYGTKKLMLLLKSKLQEEEN